MLSINSHAMVTQTQIGPQRTHLSRPSALPYDISARPTVPPMRLVPPATAGFNPTSSSLATALTPGNTTRDPSYRPYTFIQVSSTVSYKQERSLADALNPALVRHTAETAMPAHIPQAVVPGPPGGTMPTQQAQAPVEFTPAQTVWSAFPPTPGFTNGSSPEGGTPYGDPQTPVDHVGFMDPSRYTQHIQPCAMPAPVPEHPQPYHAMNLGVTTETPRPNNQRFHPAQIVGPSAIEPGGGSVQSLAPETAAAIPDTLQEPGAVVAPPMSQERWDAFLKQHGYPSIGVPFVNADFGVVLQQPKAKKPNATPRYPARIHEHRDFENTLSPNAKFNIENMRRGVEWGKLSRSEKTRAGVDPLIQYEIAVPPRTDGKKTARHFRCPLCGEVLQHLRGLSRHVESQKHLRIRHLKPTCDYASRDAWRWLGGRCPQNPQDRGEASERGVESQEEEEE